MTYAVLNQETLKIYLTQTPNLSTLLGQENWTISEIGDGNLNQVFLVESPKHKLIIKQAVPYLRCVGEDWKLSRDRMTFEIAALEKFRELAPQHIPEVFHKDEQMSLVAMQYLDNHLITRKGIIASTQYPKLAEHVATFLSKTLFKTSSYYLSSTEKRNLEQQFNQNHDLCKLTEDFVFTFPYIEHETNAIFPGMEEMAKQIQNNRLFKQHMMELKYCFMNQRDALLHADLHTGSLMSNEEETFIIDPEFAFFGPFGFDVGAFVANLVLAYAAHTVCDENQAYADWLLSTLHTFLKLFEQKFKHLWQHQQESALLPTAYFDEASFNAYQENIMLHIFQQSIGFAGCKIARRILGIAGVADIRDIQNPLIRLQAEQFALNIAVCFVEQYKTLHSIEDILDMITRLKAKHS